MMNAEKILATLENARKVYRQEAAPVYYVADLENTIDYVKQCIREKENKAAGRDGIGKAMKRVIKSAMQTGSNAFHGAWNTKKGFTAVCDGYRVIRTTEPVALKPAPDAINRFDVDPVIEKSALYSDCIPLPSASELKSMIKITKTGRRNATVVYRLAEECFVNADYLYDAIVATGATEARSEKTARDWYNNPLYMRNETTEAIVLPISAGCANHTVAIGNCYIAS